eukprot:PhF_6_TR22990/c0_g1_i1/m.32498
MSFGQRADISKYLADVLIYCICFVYVLCACVASYLFLKRSDRLVKEAFEKELAERLRLLGAGHHPNSNNHAVSIGATGAANQLQQKRLPSGLVVVVATGG